MCGSWLIYPMEYIWTKELTIKTGINIDTVKLSKWKPHKTLRDSLSIHLKRWMDTGILFKPTSKKITSASLEMTITSVFLREGKAT